KSDITNNEEAFKILSTKQNALREQISKLDEKKNFFSYVYCGIRKKQQLLTQQEIKDKLLNAFRIIQESNRTPDWLEIITTLLKDTVDPKRIKGISRKGVTPQFYDSLSSGQRILLLVLTEVIAYIEKESMIMFDEPELHLHPEAISALTRAI